jgi:hypothetical protein
MNYEGSVWRKWDLHIHSIASDGKGTVKEIVDKAKREGFDGIALTDHHTIKNIDEIKEEGKKEGICVITGIEFRSEYGSKSVHFIGLLPEENEGIILNGKSINELILNPLGISETAIITKGREKDPTFNDDIAFHEGMFLVQVDFKKASDIIHKYGGLVVVHAGTKENGIENEIKHKGASEKNTKNLYECLGTLKEELMNKYIDICEIRKEEDSEDFYLSKFNKPSITASDAHSIEDIGSRYVWIKADATFEGLRQIIYEPKDRVRICEEVPEKKKDYLVIQKLEIEHEDFGKQTILFNQNLNSIIGGRSSGKSLLLGTIAKKIGTEKNVKDDKPEYNEYIESEIIPAVSVKWCDGIEDSQRKIDYFPQSYINALAANSYEINKLIENIIKTETEKKNKLDEHSKKMIANRAEINDSIAKYFQFIEKTNDVKESILEVGSKQGIKKEIGSLEVEIEKVKNKMGIKLSKDEENEYKKLNDSVEKSNELVSNINDEIEKLEFLKKYDLFIDMDEEIENLRKDINGELRKYLREIKKETSAKWIEKITILIEKLTNEKNIINDKIKREVESELFRKGQLYYSENQTLIQLEKKLKSENSKLQEITRGEKEIGELSEKLKKTKGEIIDSNNKYYKECSDVASSINYLKDDVQIVGFVNFEDEKYSETLASKFNQRAYEIQEIVNHPYKNNTDYLDQMNMIFDRIINKSITLKSGISAQQSIIDIFTNPYYEIKYDVLYEKDKLSQMSEGKKAFIIMRMLLDFNENGYPILIDQPEDDLDNRAIYDDLVKYIRTKKLQRQIIIVTHNPNIVVGGDSELVICANQDGIETENTNHTKFEYIGGSLENTKKKTKQKSILMSQGIREHVCEILEGGDEAFIQREKKYRIAKK